MTPEHIGLFAAAKGGVIGALVSAAVNAVANYKLQKDRLREERLRLAGELVRMKYENQKWAVEKSSRPVETYVMTPPLELLRAIRAVDEIANSRTWVGEAEALKWESDNIDGGT